MGITPYPAKERVGNKVYPGMEREEINSSTANTERTRVGTNNGTDSTTKLESTHVGINDSMDSTTKD